MDQSMLIKDVETRHFLLPLSHPMTDATHGVHTNFEVIIVRIESECGLSGFGYTYTIGRGGAAIRSLVDRELRPILLGADAERIELIWERMWRGLHYIGRGGLVSFAMSAVDIAFWDLRGQQLKMPLWRLLRGPFARGTRLCRRDRPRAGRRCTGGADAPQSRVAVFARSKSRSGVTNCRKMSCACGQCAIVSARTCP